VYEVERVLDIRARLGEGTLWDPAAGVLWWLDILGQQIHRFSPATGANRSWPTPEQPGCVAVRASGGIILAMGSAFHSFDAATGGFERLASSDDLRPQLRFNDGRTDRDGRFWSGTTDMSATPTAIGALFSLDSGMCVRRRVPGIACSNGLAWAPDGKTMYHADTPEKVVWAWDFDRATGEIGNRRVFVDTTHFGLPDGATVDADGCYWLTLPFTGLIVRFDPKGRVVAKVELPTPIPTCCEFGGADLDILYVTTGALDKPVSEDPLGGGIFALRPGVKGVAAVPFAS
jgi:L-arabinonolactonase